LCLPHPATLRNWATSVNCEPGFFTDVLQRLQAEVDNKSFVKECALMMDGIHIRKQTVFDIKNQSYVGFIDLRGCIAVDADKIAGEALVFMVVEMSGH
jgi:hypothetical protein